VRLTSPKAVSHTKRDKLHEAASGEKKLFFK